MQKPAIQEIRIAKGTIVFRVTNGTGKDKGKVVHTPVELLGDVYVDATRHEDGAWGYAVQGMDGKTSCYVCAGGLGIPV